MRGLTTLHLSFWVWLLSHNIFPSFIHCRFNNFIFFTDKYCGIVCLYYIFTIHSSLEGHLGCSHFQTIMKRAAVNMPELVSVEQDVLAICQGVVQLGPLVDLILAFRDFTLIFRAATAVFFTYGEQGFLFPYHRQHLLAVLLGSLAILTGGDYFQNGFHLNFSNC